MCALVTFCCTVMGGQESISNNNSDSFIMSSPNLDSQESSISPIDEKKGTDMQTKSLSSYSKGTLLSKQVQNLLEEANKYDPIYGSSLPRGFLRDRNTKGKDNGLVPLVEKVIPPIHKKTNNRNTRKKSSTTTKKDVKKPKAAKVKGKNGRTNHKHTPISKQEIDTAREKKPLKKVRQTRRMIAIVLHQHLLIGMARVYGYNIHYLT